MSDHTRWLVFWMIAALLAVTLVCGVDYWWRHSLRDRAAWLWWFAVEWLDDAWNAGGEPGRHVALAGAGTGGTVHPPASGHNNEPGWVEDDAQTLDWMHTLHDPDDDDWLGDPDLDDYDCPGMPEQTWDAPTPPRFVRTAPIAPGVYVPLSDDTAADLPRYVGPATPASQDTRFSPYGDEPGQPYHPHAGPPAWAPAGTSPRIPCHDLDWLDELFAEHLPDWYRSRELVAAA